MAKNSEIERNLEVLRADFTSTGDAPFEHFYCPILLRDEDAELCMGHVINESIPNCSRKTVVQRKDVDNFFGSLLESHFSTALKARRVDVENIIFDPELRRDIPYKVTIEGKEVDCYEPISHKAPSHPTVQLQSETGSVLKLALKVADRELPSAGSLHVIIDKSYVAEATAVLLKAAHLTMFSIFGYQQIFGTAGQMVAEILRTFFLNNLGRSRKQQTETAREYFRQHAGMIIPLGGFDKNVLKGSIDDRRFICCVGSSGAWYAFGVLIRTDTLMSIVFLPPDKATNMDTYFEFIREMYKKEFIFQLIEYVPDSDDQPAHWRAFAKEYTFDPGPSAAEGVAKP